MKKALLLLTILLTPIVVAPAASAVDVFDKGVCDKSNTRSSAVCQDSDLGKNQENPIFGKEGVLTTAINILTIIVAIIATITIILAGLKFITSGSNPQDASKAREQIIYACVGLVVAGLAQLMVRFVINRIVEG